MFRADLERVPWRENLMVGRTLFGFLSVKFMLIATLKAEKKKVYQQQPTSPCREVQL